MGFDATALGCSTISFRSWPLRGAVETIAELGFAQVDLGAIPSVVDHVPVPVSQAQRAGIVAAVAASGLQVRSVNADPGDFNDPQLPDDELRTVADGLVALAAACEADLVVPCGAASTTPLRDLDADLDLVAERLALISSLAEPAGVRVLVEAPHLYRLCHDLDLAAALLDRVDASTAGTVLDVSHVVASGGDVAEWVRATAHRAEHVHLRDARAGEINLSIGAGEVDFAALVDALRAEGYDGSFALELETHDVSDTDRPQATAAARDYVTSLLDH